MNKVFMTGRLVKDPEMRDVKVGDDTVKKCRFRIAVERRNAEGQADFFNVVVWRKQAENCGKYLKKGSKVSVIGRLENSSFTGKDGKEIQNTDIVAEEVEFLNRVVGNENSDEQRVIDEQPLVNNVDLMPIDDDQMPF